MTGRRRTDGAPSVRGLAGSFAHLHVRSGFSYGLGTARPEELAGAAAEMGYRALALTDRDGMYGIPRFLRACGEVGLSPVVGAEVTVGIRGRTPPPRTAATSSCSPPPSAATAACRGS